MNIAKYKEYIKYYTSKKSFRYGFPFVLFCVCGSLGFKEVADIRFKYRNVESFRAKAGETGVPMKKLKDITIEAEYEKLKQVDIDTWENVRIARPWEESNDK